MAESKWVFLGWKKTILIGVIYHPYLYLVIRGPTLQLLTYVVGFLRGPKIPRRLRRWGDAESRAGGCRCVGVLGFGAKEHSEEEMTPKHHVTTNAAFLLLQVFFAAA